MREREKESKEGKRVREKEDFHLNLYIFFQADFRMAKLTGMNASHANLYSKKKFFPSLPLFLFFPISQTTYYTLGKNQKKM